MTKNTKKL